jgi:hypothetical protein
MDAPDNRTNQPSTREVWARRGLYIRIARTPDGDIRFEGQDTNPNPFGHSDYEYTITVMREDVPQVVEALGGQPGDDPLALIEANIETIVQTGERSWLQSLGIEPGFSSYP